MICLHSLNAGGKGWTQSPTVTFLFFSFYFHTMLSLLSEIYFYLLTNFFTYLSIFVLLL